MKYLIFALIILLMSGFCIIARAQEVVEREIPFFVINCPAPQGQLCGTRFTFPIQTSSLLQIQYTVAFTHCGSFRMNIYLDGQLKHTTKYFGWQAATGNFSALPLGSRLIDLGDITSGTHEVSLEADGQISGCNGSGIGSWGGSVKVITSLAGPCDDNGGLAPVPSPVDPAIDIPAETEVGETALGWATEPLPSQPFPFEFNLAKAPIK